MNQTRTTVILAACLAASAGAQEHTIEYCFAVGDNGNGDAVIEPGEAAVLTLMATMNPDQSDNGGGFAGSAFDILGINNWDTGTVLSFAGLIVGLGQEDGALQANNDITGIKLFQLPALYNPYFDGSNPIAIYQIWWQPDDYTPRQVKLADANHLYDEVYTDAFGTSMSYEPTSCGIGSFRVVPTPGTLAMLGLGGMLSARRRRR